MWQLLSGIRLAHVSLICIGLMWVWPFLYYRHAYPLSTFDQEWSAAMLGLCAASLLVTRSYWLQPEIPRVVLLPIGLMLLVLVQFALGKIPYFDQALLYTLYLLWAALLIMLGQRLREEFGLPVLATVLAAFLLLGAELSAAIGVLQHFSWHTFLDGVVAGKISTAVFGNMGQPNHFANYITLGLVSLGLLRIRWSLRAWQVGALAVPLLFVMALTGSRSTWLYLLCITSMAFLWQRRDKASLPLLRYCLLLVLGFGLMHLAVQIPWLAGSAGSVTTMERLTSQVGGSSVRLAIWHEAWLIFTQFPWLGAGFGQFAWQHFLIGPSLHNTNIAGLYTSAHNLLMHTAAEMGLAGLLIWFGALVLWVKQACAMPRTIYHWWGYCLLSILAIHSLLEYPLWYAYFLGVAALTLGMLDHTTYRLELRGVGRLSVATILLLGALSLLQLWQGYRKLESLQSIRPTSATDTSYVQRLRDGLTEGYGQALLRPYVELMIISIIDVSTDRLDDRRELNESVMRFVPSSSVVYREVYLLALSGEQAAAQLQIERAIWAFPGDFPKARERLRLLAQKDPVHFAALLEFALQKYEGYQLAVHTK